MLSLCSTKSFQRLQRGISRGFSPRCALPTSQPINRAVYLDEIPQRRSFRIKTPGDHAHSLELINYYKKWKLHEELGNTLQAKIFQDKYEQKVPEINAIRKIHNGTRMCKKIRKKNDLVPGVIKFRDKLPSEHIPIWIERRLIMSHSDRDQFMHYRWGRKYLLKLDDGTEYLVAPTNVQLLGYKLQYPQHVSFTVANSIEEKQPLPPFKKKSRFKPEDAIPKPYYVQFFEFASFLRRKKKAKVK